MIGKVNLGIGRTSMPNNPRVYLQILLLLQVIDRCTANCNLELQIADQPAIVQSN